MPFLPIDLEIILASASPRRQELLALTGWRFSVCSSEIPELPQPGEEPEKLAKRLAVSKANAAKDVCPDVSAILAADTLVIHAGDILGKPSGPSEAVDMLRGLRGAAHDVITAIAIEIEDKGKATQICESRVPMRDYAEDELQAYVQSGAPMDKAGAYGIQDPGFHPVDLERFSDCYANVMGLPLCHLVRAMRQLGFEPPNDVPGACMQFTGYDCTIYPIILGSEL